MKTIHSRVLQPTLHLPNHQRILKSSLDFFLNLGTVDGAFLQGGLATGKSGPFAPINLGLFFHSKKNLEQVWSIRSEWKLLRSLRLLKAQVQTPPSLTYVADPSLHLEFCFYTLEDLPQENEGPFILAWDRTGHLDLWIKETHQILSQRLSWDHVIHEDERFWAWTHYSATHAVRGDYQEVVHHLEDLREIVQSWQKRIDGLARQNSKQVGNRFQNEFVDRLTKTYCPPHKDSIKNAYKNLFKIQLQQRALIGRTVGTQWKVTPATISKIQEYSLNW